MGKIKTVITYGTFDCFHIGHLKLLMRAAELGDRLVVGVSTDHFNENQKGKRTLFPYSERSEIVGAIKCVDLVFPENAWSQKRDDIVKHEADVFVIGDDWLGKFDSLVGDLCQVIYLPRTANISSTHIKRQLYSITKARG